MSHCTPSDVVAKWFTKHARLVYWLARNRCYGLLHARTGDCSPDRVEEIAQDAVCRAYDRMLKRCKRQPCPESECRDWICQCVKMASFDACRAKSTFGSITSPSVVRDDVMNRRHRVQLSSRGDRDNDETSDTLQQVEYKPVTYHAQRWELEQVAERELPVHLRPTAVSRACGMTLQQSATLQGVSSRTVSYRLREAQAYLLGDSA